MATGVSVAPSTRSSPELSPRPLHGQDNGDPRPLYFGREGRPLFGWLHPAPSASLGLVICNPFGDEAIRAHRAIRHLAQSASKAGIPTLRFDYDGTGDSAGHDLEPARLSEWLRSIHAAADTLQRLSGVRCLCFAGIRLGATLATLAAAERTDIAALVAIAPIVSGKAYVRELRLLQRAMESKYNTVASTGEGNMETAGFVLEQGTQSALTAVDLLLAERAPAPRVLILDRVELPSAEKWAQRLRALHAQVDYSPASGYSEMMLDSHESIVPENTIHTTCSWLCEVAKNPPPTLPQALSGLTAANDRATLAPGGVPDPVLEDPPQASIEERAVCFGGPSRLFGIISTIKDRPAARTNQTAVLILNAGAVHHIGPSRMHVTFARYLAAIGYTVLRMDIGSIGDSPAHPDQPEIDVYSSYALADVASAVEYLQKEWHASQVISMGLCSGAYHSFKAAVAHYPLARVILINPLTFFWKPGMSMSYPDHRVAEDLQRYRATAFQFGAWKKLLTGRVDLPNLVRVLIRSAQMRAIGPIRTIIRALGRPLRDDLPTELQSAVQSTDVQFVFSAGDPGLVLLRTQGGKTARRLHARNKIGIDLIEGATHTFTDLSTRRSLMQILAARIQGRRASAGT
jgi:predicted alpha/beta hydrolase